MKGAIIIWIVVAIIIMIALFAVGISITEKAKEAYEKEKYELELFTRAAILKTRPFDINRFLIPKDVANKARMDDYMCWVWDKYDTIYYWFPTKSGAGGFHCPPANDNYFYKTYGENYSNLIKNCVKKSILENKPCVVVEDLKLNDGLSRLLDYYLLYNVSFPKDTSVNEPLFYEKDGKKQMICNFNVSRFPTTTAISRYGTSNVPIYLWQNDTILFNNFEKYQPFIHGGYFPDDFKNTKNISKIYVIPPYTSDFYLTGGPRLTHLKHSLRIVVADAYVANDETRDCMFNIYIFDQIEIGSDESDATVTLFNVIKNMPDDLFKFGEVKINLDLGDGGYSCDEMFSAIDAGLWEWNRQNFYNKDIIKMMNNSYYKLYNIKCDGTNDHADIANVVFFDMRPWTEDSRRRNTAPINGPLYLALNPYGNPYDCPVWKKALIYIDIPFDSNRVATVNCIKYANNKNTYGIRLMPRILIQNIPKGE